MTVHRIGVPDKVDSAQQSLGHVLVTIDDLAALVDLLSRGSEGSKPSIAFEGGYLDEAEDMRTMSDAELQRLAVQSDQGTVVLAPNRAVAIGPNRFVTDVYRNWSRSRQTDEKPANEAVWSEALRIRIRALPILAIVGMLAFLAIFLLLQFVGPIDWGSLDFWFLPLIAGAAGGPLLSWFLIRLSYYLAKRNAQSYAIIRPVSLDEYRQRLIGSKRHVQNFKVAAAGLVCTVIGLIIGIVV